MVDAGGGGDYRQIQSAIDAASSGDVIEIRAGSYSESLDTGGLQLSLQGAGSTSVLVSGDGSQAVLTVDQSAAVDVSGVTLQGGDRGAVVRLTQVDFDDVAFSDNSATGMGAGLGVFEGAQVSLTDCSIEDNEAQNYYVGGGLAIDEASASLDACTVQGNQSYRGGGLYLAGGEADLQDTVFDDNSATTDGGGIYVEEAGSLQATSVTLSGNQAGGGGGAAALEDSDSVWSGCILEGNQSGSGGGALYLSGMDSAGTQLDATVEANASAGSGGAIWAWDHDLEVSGSLAGNLAGSKANGGGIYAGSLDLFLRDVELEGHEAENGGAVYLISGATVTLEDASFSDNCAQQSGGAVYAVDSLTVSGGEFSGNQASDNGGALYLSGGQASLQDCGFAGNQAGGGGGALYSYGADVDVARIELEGNAATHGGALCLLGGGGSGLAVQVGESSFEDNSASQHGGGLYLDGLASATVEDSQFSGNMAGSWGGGLFLLSIDSAQLASLGLWENQALAGGGLYAASLGGGSSWELELGGNAATSEGGGAVYSAPSGEHPLKNLRFIENSAPVGAGLLLSADESGAHGVSNLDVVGNQGDGIWLASAPATSIVNVVAASNSGTGIGSDAAEHQATLAYNDCWDNGEDWGGELPDQIGVAGNISVDPLYADFVADGSWADSLLLTSYSPVRDAGDPDLADLDGSRSDMGSYGGPEAADGDADGDGVLRSESDCDDSEASAYPGAEEVWYDGVDQDCDGSDDYDRDGDGVPYPEDCEDEDPEIHPGAKDPEGDGVDQDCDGADGLASGDTGDTGRPHDDDDYDGDGYSPPEDCNDMEYAANPGLAERCDDGFDNDCDGYVDGSDADCLIETEEGGCYCGSRERRGGAWWLGLFGVVLVWRRRAPRVDVHHQPE